MEINLIFLYWLILFFKMVFSFDYNRLLSNKINSIFSKQYVCFCKDLSIKFSLILLCLDKLSIIEMLSI